MDPRLAALRRQYQCPGQEGAPLTQVEMYNSPTTQRHLVLRRSGDGTRDYRHYVVDTLFPQVLEGRTDMASVDEGTADLLYGLVRGLQPRVVLETGTHRGRSTRALATALRDNAEIEMMQHSYTGYLETKGHLYTVDAEDHKIFESGALPESAQPYVTHIIGWTPDVFTANKYLRELTGLDFAFLDGDHTPEGLAAELAYVDAHRNGGECWVAVDNSRDRGWPKLRACLDGYTTYPRLSLGTCTGMDLIWMHGQSPAPVSGRNGQPPATEGPR